MLGCGVPGPPLNLLPSIPFSFSSSLSPGPPGFIRSLNQSQEVETRVKKSKSGQNRKSGQSYLLINRCTLFPVDPFAQRGIRDRHGRLSAVRGPLDLHCHHRKARCNFQDSPPLCLHMLHLGHRPVSASSCKRPNSIDISKQTVGIEKRKDQPPWKSSLLMLIESIEDVLEIFADESLFLTTIPNPFNSDPQDYRFEQEADSKHDVKLLKSQLASLREILASLSDR